MESFSDIELTEEEVLRAMIEAKKKKRALIKSREHWKKVNEELVYPKYQAEDLFRGVQKAASELIKNFTVDSFNEEIIFKMALYFSEDKRFEESGYSLNKGLMLYGNVGCGKTTLMRLFSENQKSSYMTISCRKIASDYAESGYSAIEKYFGLYQNILHGKGFGHSGSLGICFDDLGTEDVKKHFGSQSNVMAEVILNRYDRSNLLQGKTHITTNLTGDNIEEMYGNRVRSRMREMFNIISFDKQSPDRRI